MSPYLFRRFGAWLVILFLAVSCAALPSCGGGSKKGPRIPPGEESALGISGIVNDADLFGRQRSELEREANDPPIDPFSEDGFTDPEPAESVPLESPEPKQFRAGTHNAFVMSARKAAKPNPVPGLFGGDFVWETVFDLMEMVSIDVLAVQEVYLTELRIIRPPRPGTIEKISDHELLKRGDMVVKGKYKLIRGDPVFRFSSTFIHKPSGQERQVTRREYCPVIFNMEVLTCEEDGNRPIGFGRNIHFAKCSVNGSDPKLEFLFGCAHFAANQSRTGENIERTGALMTGKMIIGGDFNSNVFGAQKNRYAAIAELDRDPDTQALGKFSKFRRQGREIKLRINKAFLVLDDVIWTVAMRPFYDKNSKRIVDYGKQLPQDEDFFLDLYDLQDHLPVVVDFMDTAEGT